MLVVQAERDTEMYLADLAFNLVETVVHLGQLGKTWRKPGFHWIQGCVCLRCQSICLSGLRRVQAIHAWT